MPIESKRGGPGSTQTPRGLVSISEVEEYMETQYKRLKDKKAFVSLNEI